MSETLWVRPFAAPDIEQMRALVLGIQNGEFGVPITLEDQADLVDPPGYFRHGLGEIWVADLGGEIVGTIALVDIGEGDSALRKMFVRKDCRGSGLGVARALLDGLLAHARAHGLRRVFLGTIDEFRAAHRFYEKSGFRLVAQPDLPPSFPLMGHDTRFYGMDL